MRWLLVFLAAHGWAQVFDVSPQHIRQGETLKVVGGRTARSARMNDRSVLLFSQDDGTTLGLMPIPVLTKPGDYTLDFLDEKGVVLHSISITIVDAHYRRENIVIAPAIASLKPSPGEQQTVGEFRKAVTATRYWKEPFEAPVRGCVTSPFGSLRMHNGKLTGDFHAGIDQRGAMGTPIHPITPGIVKLVKQYNLRGGTVAIDHGQGLESIYLHMSGFAVKEGQHVTPADAIGYIGSTGRSTGAHVHWTMYVNGEPVNPGQWISFQRCSAAAPAAKKTATKIGKAAN